MVKELFGFTVTDDTESVHVGDTLKLVRDGEPNTSATVCTLVVVTDRGKLNCGNFPDWENPGSRRIWKVVKKSNVPGADGEWQPDVNQTVDTNHTVDVTSGYEPLFNELIAALNQSQAGKGKERHAEDGQPFLEQPIMTNARQCGAGGPAQQVMKKTGEAIGMHKRGQTDRAIAELHGAMVYAAATILIMKEESES